MSAFAAMLLAWLVCACADSGGGSAVPSGGTVTPDGGSVSLEGVATVDFEAGAFAAPQAVRIETTTSTEIAEQFDETADLWQPSGRSGYEVRINTGTTGPGPGDVTIHLVVPKGLVAPEGESIEAFAQVFEASDLDTHDVFRLVPSTFDAASNTVSFAIAGAQFTNLRTADQSFELVALLAAVPAVNEGQAAAGLKADSTENCECKEIGVIGPPLAHLKVGSKFDPNRDNSFVKLPPGHYGTDYKGADGDPVLAVANGKIIAAKDASAGGYGGFGGYVALKIPCVGVAKYGHLKSGSVTVTAGQEVKGGQQIAQVDSTGKSTGPHLHFELKPENRKNRVDPDKQVMSGYTGTITMKSVGPPAHIVGSVTAEGVKLQLEEDNCTVTRFTPTGTSKVEGPLKDSVIGTCSFDAADGEVIGFVELFKIQDGNGGYDKYWLTFRTGEVIANGDCPDVSPPYKGPIGVEAEFDLVGPDCLAQFYPLTDTASFQGKYEHSAPCDMQNDGFSATWSFQQQGR
jgi:murein DD-endopeptidase MepM/ murein hydrolase activator NlpD